MKAKEFVNFKSGKYYFNEQGEAVTGLQQIDKTYYYFSNEGIMQTGAVKTGKYIYVFDKSSGKFKEKVNGWITLSDDRYYCVDGKYSVGLTSILNGFYSEQYYFSSDGKLVTNKDVSIGAKTYKIDSSGIVYNIIDNTVALISELSLLKIQNDSISENINRYETALDEANKLKTKYEGSLSNAKTTLSNVQNQGSRMVYGSDGNVSYRADPTKVSNAQWYVDLYQDYLDEANDLVKMAKEKISEAKKELTETSKRIKEIEKILS